jgi:hypothetical protein
MAEKLQLDIRLKEWATPRQAEFIEAINLHGGLKAACRANKWDERSVYGAIGRLKKNAALHGYSLQHNMVETVPEPYVVKGVSTYYGKDGEKRGQWVKSQLDHDKLNEMMRAAASAMSEDLPRIKPVQAPAITSAALCNLFTLTDCHVGMLAWHKEGGSDWDLRIAEKTLTECFVQMIAAAPPARVGIINQLGDYLHFDGLAAVTPEHRNLLDADGRFPKIVETAIRVLRQMIAASLEHHELVHLVLAEGNHDPASSVWLRKMFKVLYENEPRVSVDDTELPYYAYQHDRVMLAFHHGHMTKNASLPLFFAARYPQMWGATTKRYIHTGHRHSKEEKEHPGVLVVQHPTLAAPDAYASRNGWLSERDATVMTYHGQYGLVARNTVLPEMLENAA